MLSAEVRQQASAVGAADIVVGIPTYNNAGAVGAVVDAVRAGLQKHFGGQRAVLVHTDARSTDETLAEVGRAEWDGPRLVAEHDGPPAERLTVPFHGVPGRGAAHQAILEVATLLGARACLFVPADRPGLAPEWVDRLLRPILADDHDYVVPLHQRHRYEGTLTTALVAPLVRALWGRRIRQPLGGEIALSGRLVEHLCQDETWGGEELRDGIDLWALAAAVTEHFSVCEAWLGPYAAGAPHRSMDVATTLAQVGDTVFAVQERTSPAWREVQGSQPVPVVGRPLPLGVAPIELNLAGMVRAFRLGLRHLLPVWEQVLAPDTLADVLGLEPPAEEEPSFPHALWARVVYDYAVGYHLRVLYRPHLLRSLGPLYLGRTAAFIVETVGSGARETEAWIEAGQRAFEQEKTYLLARWP